MQTLDVISVNIWQMAVSLANLVLLFLIVKRFLYKPVKNMLALRRSRIDAEYSDARDAHAAAEESRIAYEEKLASAKDTADGILKGAVEGAALREKQIIEEAQRKADGIVRKAEADAALETKKAEEHIRRQIVEVSTMISEKMLMREISEDDHKELFDPFIEGIGDGNDAD